MVCSNCGHKGLTSGNSRFDSALRMEQDREDRHRAIGELRAKKRSLSHSDKNKRKGIPDKPEKTLTRHLRFNLSNIYRSKTREGDKHYTRSSDCIQEDEDLGNQSDTDECEPQDVESGKQDKLIQDSIRRGSLQNRFHNLLKIYPTCRLIIKQNLDLRPPRRHKTHCMYIHGPIGIGKTKYTRAVLNAINKQYPEIDYYMKSYGFISEYWDGYSNQVTAVVDDPSQPNQYKQDQFLNVGRIY